MARREQQFARQRSIVARRNRRELASGAEPADTDLRSRGIVPDVVADTVEAHRVQHPSMPVQAADVSRHRWDRNASDKTVRPRATSSSTTGGSSAR